ncbi:Co2+/Mg2+ efflux protein ApaG [Flavobacteriales bacterium]|nr:Co2+/Mg2+ efflux protein ApaG [Flavobacteriales bacterium]
MKRTKVYRATTEGIRVHVRSRYEAEFSKPCDRKFIFSYRITIENRSHLGIKIMKRRWHIVDSLGKVRDIEGTGIVGVQPEILPGRVFEYDSACDLSSTLGSMSGIYEVSPHRRGAAPCFDVTIPTFQLEVPWALS